MVYLISGATHTGKTLLAHRLMLKYGCPYLSADHLKMGLIRGGYTDLSPEDSDAVLTEYLWPAIEGIIKTAVENGQSLIIEGVYIPFDWKTHFDDTYLREIRCRFLIMSEAYIRKNFDAVKAHACDIERRTDDTYCTREILLRDNAVTLEQCVKHGCEYLLIDGGYKVTDDIFDEGE